MWGFFFYAKNEDLSFSRFDWQNVWLMSSRVLFSCYDTSLVCVSIDIHTESVDSTKKLGFYLKRRHCQHGQTIHIWSQDIVFTHFEILLTSAKYWWLYIQYNIKFKNPIPNVNHLGHTKNKFSKTCTLYK